MIDPFSRVLAAFRGEPVPLDEGGAQALWFAAQADADLAITRQSFQLRPSGRHELDYPLESAPGVLTVLLERVGCPAPRSLKTWTERREIQAGRFPPFTLPVRHVLAESWTSRVMIRIREHEAALDDELPTLSVKRFARYAHACSSCGVVPERYRVLTANSLVCVACGASSAKPPGAPAGTT